MNQVSRVIGWSEFLVDCITGACAGLLIGLLLPVGRVAEKFTNGFEFGPGQSSILAGGVGLLLGAIFFFIRSDAEERNRAPAKTFEQNAFSRDHTITIVSTILILTVVAQVMLVKSWT
jgi:hypothetical protein